MSASSDYARVAAAVEHLARHRGDQPDLAELARAAGLSPFHFQRLFTRWAGVSPKRYLQFLTVEHAKALLRASRSVLDAAYESGLSTPSRLHDHFVALDAVTPGEFRSFGAGLVLRAGVVDTPFGRAFAAASPRGICSLRFLDAEAADPRASLAAAWPGARILSDPGHLRQIIEPVFEASGERPPLHVRGTNFQIQIWRALLAMPEGSLTSYEALGQRVGRSRSARAVGSAVGANTVALLIPCHRVLRGDGTTGGYRWGLARKQAILARESSMAARRR